MKKQNITQQADETLKTSQIGDHTSLTASPPKGCENLPHNLCENEDQNASKIQLFFNLFSQSLDGKFSQELCAGALNYQLCDKSVLDTQRRANLHTAKSLNTVFVNLY